MEEKNYYDILGVSENASQDEIKKAFKKLSLEYHPDRHVSDSEEVRKKCEDKFKEISEAYNTLGDENKRREYDNRNNGFDFGGFNPFADFFGGMHRQQRQERGNDIQVNVAITLQQAYEGGEIEIRVEREEKCSDCNGTGSADGKDTTCPHCHGTGMITERSQKGNVMFQSSHPCQYCNGTGKVITHPCKKCHGTGFEKRTEKEKINIPRGIADGMTMKVEYKGSLPKGNGIPGDLYVTFNVIPDNYFTRPDAINLIHYEDVDFKDAMLGFEKEFKTISGKTIKIKIPECTHDNQAFIQKGYGMPDINNNGRNGDYAVIIRYKYPNKLTKEQREKLSNF